MNTAEVRAPNYNPIQVKEVASPVLKMKNSLKLLVKTIEKILPKPIFNAFYNVSFPIYKALIKIIYRAKVVKWSLTGDSDRANTGSEVISVMPYSLVGIFGLEATFNLARELNKKNIAGSFVELGVARGGCAALLGRAAFSYDNTNRDLWLFDSFEGLPEAGAEDFVDGHTGDHVRPLPKGSCLGTLPEVQKLLLENFKFPRERVHFVKGWFEESLPVWSDKIGKIALLRIDGDWYSSTKTCLEHLFNKVSEGGVVVVDDYQSCYGCKKAVDEFLGNNNLNPEIILDGRGGCYFFV